VPAFGSGSANPEAIRFSEIRPSPIFWQNLRMPVTGYSINYGHCRRWKISATLPGTISDLAPDTNVLAQLNSNPM